MQELEGKLASMQDECDTLTEEVAFSNRYAAQRAIVELTMLASVVQSNGMQVLRTSSFTHTSGRT